MTLAGRRRPVLCDAAMDVPDPAVDIRARHAHGASPGRRARVILAGDLNVALTTQDPYYLQCGGAILGALKGHRVAIVDAAPASRRRRPRRGSPPRPRRKRGSRSRPPTPCWPRRPHWHQAPRPRGRTRWGPGRSPLRPTGSAAGRRQLSGSTRLTSLAAQRRPLSESGAGWASAWASAAGWARGVGVATGRRRRRGPHAARAADGAAVGPARWSRDRPRPSTGVQLAHGRSAAPRPRSRVRRA
jgi:hypothetical protein